MSDTNNDGQQPDNTKSEKAKKKSDLVRLQHAIDYDGELVCEKTSYPVVAGAVEVNPWHVEHAKQAGFR
jgi:hypothetical protein